MYWRHTRLQLYAHTYTIGDFSDELALVSSMCKTFVLVFVNSKTIPIVETVNLGYDNIRRPIIPKANRPTTTAESAWVIY